MVWIYLALWAYFLNAISFVIDKYLLAAPIPKPYVYAFWVAILSSGAIVLIPFGVTPVPLADLLLSLLSGAAFFGGLVFLYKSLKYGDVSVGATKTGTFTVIFSHVFSWIILGVKAVHIDFIAVGLLVAGIAMLAQIGRSILRYSILSGALFALSLVLLKLIFTHLDFINGLFWTRMGFVAVALFSLGIPALRHQVMTGFKTAGPSSRVIFILNKLVAGCGFVSLYYAINLGNVAVVNSMIGLQFVFIFLLALMLHKKVPGIAENLRRKVLFNKVVGIILITAGFFKVLFA